MEAFVEVGRATWHETGFWEREVWSRVDGFGNVAQVRSAYESRVGTENSAPVSRGVNSIQLVRAAGRWWIAAVAWDLESADRPIPAVLTEQA